MGTGKGRIAILMALYEPRMDWLREQLMSLEAQTYPDLTLYVRDDCSSQASFDEAERCIKECIRSFPYVLRRNETNLGSNGTFERLTAEAEGEYFAYCDQDDVWLPEKLTTLQQALESQRAELVCSDMYVIDGDGKRTADSVTQVWKGHRFYSGEDVMKQLMIKNFVTGCTMLVRAGTAKEAIPFCPYMVHDYHIAVCAAKKGTVISLPQQLIGYRIHGGNQTLLMKGIHDKKSYCKILVEENIARLEWMIDKFQDDAQLVADMQVCLAWMRARRDNLLGVKGAKKRVLAGFSFGRRQSLFEVVMAGMPEWLFMIPVELKRRSIL